MSKCVLILSGGMDSGTLLFDLHEQGKTIHALTFDYGQRHRREIFYAQKLAETLNVPHQVVDLSALRPIFGKSSQTDPSVPVPEGHYAEENMKQTVVPNRNMIMLAVAIAYAIGIEAREVFYGAHAGDHAIYPDCRKEFVRAMQEAAHLCDWNPAIVMAPYLDLTKVEILERGARLGVPYETTWTCYRGEAEPCGKCGACQERAEAFAKNNIPDPALAHV